MPVDWWWQDDKAALPGLKLTVARRLIAAEYLTAEQIRAAGPKQLLRIERLGQKGLSEIKNWLRKLDDKAEKQRGDGRHHCSDEPESA